MNPAILDEMSWAMAEVYAAVTDRILINLARYFPYVREGAKLPGSFEYQARMLAQVGQVNRETVAIIMQSLGGADEALRGVLERAIMEGLRSEEPALRRAAERGLLTSGVPELTPGMTQAFRSYYRQSADRLNLVNTVMLESTQAAYTATVADIANKIAVTQSALNVAAGEVVTGVSTFNQALHGAVNKMVQNGLTGFVDHAGRHWSPEAYVAMDIRTTTANTARQAVFDRNQEYGNDLYLVSSHDGARPLCYPWQGKIISTTGRKGTTTDLDGNTYTIHSEDEIESFRYGGGLFGVNCGHYPMVWVPGFSTMKGQPQDEEANAKQYEESQQQRALERKLREEKRDLEVMKAQGAPEEQIKAQRQRVRDASAEIDDFCEQTGRARHRDREGAPVRATWPETNRFTTEQDFDREIERLRLERSRAFESDTYDKAVTDRQLAEILELEDRKAEFIASRERAAYNASVVSARPANEQPILAQYNRFDTSMRTDAQMLAQINPNYREKTREWTYNCQRTTTALEMVYRGYDVTAMPYNKNDPVSDVMWNAWKNPNIDRINITNRSQFITTVSDAFSNWGDGSRGIVRLKWTAANGGNGHFIFARNVNGTIIYSDPQNNSIINIEDLISKLTTSRNQMWVMRTDNKEVTDNIVYAIRNRGE